MIGICRIYILVTYVLTCMITAIPCIYSRPNYSCTDIAGAYIPPVQPCIHAARHTTDLTSPLLGISNEMCKWKSVVQTSHPIQYDLAGSRRCGCLCALSCGPQHPPVLMPPPCCELEQMEKVTARPTAGSTHSHQLSTS
jgi:hypothetical protein